MALLFTYLFLAVFISFMCSLLEAVILSVTPSFVNSEVKEGKKYAVVLQRLKETIDRPLAAILTLNTIAHTVGAAGVGSEVNKICVYKRNRYIKIFKKWSTGPSARMGRPFFGGGGA